MPPEGQVAFTLREVCGLGTEETARAFLVTPARSPNASCAKAEIREASIPTRCRCRTSCRNGWTRCFKPSISSSTRGTPLRLLYAASRDCICSRRGGVGRRHRLAAERRALQPAGTSSVLAGCPSKSRRRHCRMRWTSGRSDAYRRAVGRWQTGELLAGAFSPCRVVLPAW